METYNIFCYNERRCKAIAVHNLTSVPELLILHNDWRKKQWNIKQKVRSQSKADLQEIINNADIDDEQKVHNVKFIGGCSGNTQGVAKLVEGMPAKEVIARLEGIQCGRRPTSCPDQLATALKEAIS